MEILKMSIFDLVDSPRLAKMVYTVQHVLEKVPIEKLTLQNFPLEVIEPIFSPSKKNFDYMQRMTLALMITHIEQRNEEDDLPAFCLDPDDVDSIVFGMVKEGAVFVAEALELPKSFLPPGCDKALSQALVKWSKNSKPFEKDARVPGSVRREAELFVKNAMDAAADCMEKRYKSGDSDLDFDKLWKKVHSRMQH